MAWKNCVLSVIFTHAPLKRSMSVLSNLLQAQYTLGVRRILMHFENGTRLKLEFDVWRDS